MLLVSVGPPKYLARPFRPRLGLVTYGNSGKQRQKRRVVPGLIDGPSPMHTFPTPSTPPGRSITRMLILDTRVSSTRNQFIIEHFIAPAVFKVEFEHYSL